MKSNNSGYNLIPSENRAHIRELYRLACHGAGAEPRRQARRDLENIAQTHGLLIGKLLEEYNLDLGAYFASRPID